MTDKFLDTQVRRLLPIANRYKVYSVVRKCEFQLLCLLENDASSETLQRYFNLALWYNLKTLWNVCLKRVTSLEELKVYTSQMNVGSMPGEAMKKMIMFHSPIIESFIGTGFRRMPMIRHSYYCELLLQLIHGTQLQLSYTQVRRLLPIANRYKVYSVVRKCEFQLLCLMENDASSETIQEYFNLALWYNLKTLWNVCLKRVTSLEELKVYTSQMNVGTMPGEAMKKVAQRIFSFA
ncbi:hypothetical protein GCK72_006875 [Caenorhabditis remanei]|uniref:BTB domain-containing protein n=1 Tax=Caenorhabditis remanei TaxID=31234 RepID=A0A6A5HJZ1_CAERE|nr:hypothetical protein GCK72_006875 [Caenorhabditis remanei]KAF1766917.1 hypothetical protein GCK72_006875 [Caenorhabditis remanei]